MKYLSLIILGVSLFSTGLLFSQQFQRRQCTCRDCKCTAESHCGCYSDKGCACKSGGASCCSDGQCSGR